MEQASLHTFHIPVMGLGFTIDTPVKVAHFGISSVISIIEDHLIEQMREVICRNYNLFYAPINEDQQDSRAKRITAYLNLVSFVVDGNIYSLKIQSFSPESDLSKYFELLPDDAKAKQLYYKLAQQSGSQRTANEDYLRSLIIPGAIDVNIMTKVDKTNYSKSGEQLPAQYSDALAALRGFAKSSLSSAVIFSAGLNPRLYSYCEEFPDFFPDNNGTLKKKIILKVSDYRSALIQGKFLAKKGIWISEFRIESGLNCGGHAFATTGMLLGPILEEFKEKRQELYDELFSVCSQALAAKEKPFVSKPTLKITAQGGLGTAAENQFLLDHYKLNATGWGSPFLLVPEVTCVDTDTLSKLAEAKPEDYYLSHSSPLGVPFNNFRYSSSEVQRKLRIEKKRPGSPCYKKFLSTNSEFTERPICTASREYQNLKIKEVQQNFAGSSELQDMIRKIEEKDCLCEGLGTSALLKNKTKLSHGLKAVAICPGPNLAYFSGVFTMKQMVDHIYGRNNILNSVKRPHVFVNELKLYVDYLRTEVRDTLQSNMQKKTAYFNTFKQNLMKSIDYYVNLMPLLKLVSDAAREMHFQLQDLRGQLELIPIGTVENKT